MRLFIGRQRELDLLQRIYDEENVKMCMIHGSRLIGKLSLLRRFSEGRLALFSMSGFDAELMEYVGSNGILLFGPDVLVGLEPVPEVE